MTIQQMMFTSAAQSPTLWTPDQLGNLVGWWDAQDAGTITLTGNSVDRWYDKVNVARYAEQTTGSNKPTYNATNRNSRPGLNFDGGDYLNLSSLDGFPTGSANSVVYCVANTTGTSWAAALAWGTDSGGSHRSLGVAGTPAVFASPGDHVWDTWQDDSGSGRTWLNDNIVIVRHHANSGSTQGFYYINGNTAISGDAVAAVSTSSTRGRIGNDAASSPGSPWQGGIQEICVFSGALAAADIIKLEGYAAYRWNTQFLLPGGHAHKTTPPYL